MPPAGLLALALVAVADAARLSHGSAHRRSLTQLLRRQSPRPDFGTPPTVDEVAEETARAVGPPRLGEPWNPDSSGKTDQGDNAGKGDPVLGNLLKPGRAVRGSPRSAPRPTAPLPHMAGHSSQDGWEHYETAAGDVADWAVGAASGGPDDGSRNYDGSTCAGACLPCIVEQNTNPQCACRASCAKAARPGWSLKSVSQPQEFWKSTCSGEGDVDCATCVDEGTLADIRKCGGSQWCLMRVLGRAARGGRFCFSDQSPECQEFQSEPEGDNWKCFASKRECAESPTKPTTNLEYEASIPPLETPCVWCSIPAKASA